MTIWINVTTSSLWDGEPVGIVRTEVEITSRLCKHYEDRVGLCRFVNGAFEQVDRRLYLKDGIEQIGVGDQRKALNSGSLPALRIFSPGDVFITLGHDWDYNFSQYLFVLRKYQKVEVVTFCYDTIPVLYPQWCASGVPVKWKDYLLDLGEGSTCTMCISECTRRDFARVLNRVGGRIPRTERIRLGAEGSGKYTIGEIREQVKKCLESPFILYVSTVERRKNHEVIARAYHRILTGNPDRKLPKIVFAGMRGWGVDDAIRDMQLDPLVKDLIVFVGRVNDSELKALYAHSQFVVFPSLYEGWGLGVAEALKSGKFVLSSDAGSLREVGGSLAWYANPWDVSDWAAKIDQIVTHPETLAELEQKVRANYVPYSWNDAATDVISVIESLRSSLKEEAPLSVPKCVLEELKRRSRPKTEKSIPETDAGEVDEANEGGVIVRRKDLKKYRWNSLKWAVMSLAALSKEKRQYFAHKRKLLRRLYQRRNL